MQWNDHSKDFPEGSHTLFSPSQPAWRNDATSEDVLSRYYRSLAPIIGTAVHEEARDCIITNTKYTVKEAKKVLTKKLLTYNPQIPRGAFDVDFLSPNFVNYITDAIGYMMTPEQRLYYSEWFGGTTDAIIFEQKKRILRIHDLKTGVNPAKFEQLENYAALFFLEYGKKLDVRPGDCQIELRIYQAGEILEEYPTAEEILPVMDSIIWHTNIMVKATEG